RCGSGRRWRRRSISTRTPSRSFSRTPSAMPSPNSPARALSSRAEPADAAVILAALQDGLRPDPALTVSEWADAHRMLSGRAAAEPGRWRTSRTPYLREPGDCLSGRSPIHRVVVQKAAQLGFTETAVNWLGYAIAHAPAPFLFVQPTVELGKRLVRQGGGTAAAGG